MRLIYFLILFNLFCLHSYSKNAFKQDITKPIKIEANEVSLKKNTNYIIFTGNVEAKQDDLTIYTDKMFVYYTKNNKTEIQKIKAIGNVVLKNQTITAFGDEGIYNLKNNLITLEDNVVLNEKDIVVYGDKMTYNTITKESNINTKQEKKRITIILDNIDDIKERYDKD